MKKHPAQLTLPEHGFTQIWFFVEGQPKRFRCEHQAGWFRIGHEDLGQTELICTHGKRHRVLSGFFLESPDAEEAPLIWFGRLLRGEQLKLKFPARVLKFGKG